MPVRADVGGCDVVDPVARVLGGLLHKHPHGQAINQAPWGGRVIMEAFKQPCDDDSGRFSQTGGDIDDVRPRLGRQFYLVGVWGKVLACGDLEKLFVVVFQDSILAKSGLKRRKMALGGRSIKTFNAFFKYKTPLLAQEVGFSIQTIASVPFGYEVWELI